MNRKINSEKEAAISFAKAWNRLDCKDFIELLADDAHYASQYVFKELTSKEGIAAYLRPKMQTVKASRTKVFAELGVTQAGLKGRDCTFLCQGSKEEITAAILFKVTDGKVSRYDLVIPDLVQVQRSGVYPI